MYNSTSHQKSHSVNNATALRSKLLSLQESFKSIPIHININKIEDLINSKSNNKITAWNWSKSFSQD
ncbi:no significant database hits [Yersinia aldovae]|nr:darobactin family peptide antibiotic [Yersinia aldovae]CNH02432.1 no significant database hits [Yersinia aldovae]